jgi:hypothetical protein
MYNGKEKIKSRVGVGLNFGSPNLKLMSFIEYPAETANAIRIIQNMEAAMPSIRIGISIEFSSSR